MLSSPGMFLGYFVASGETSLPVGMEEILSRSTNSSGNILRGARMRSSIEILVSFHFYYTAISVCLSTLPFSTAFPKVLICELLTI